MDIHETIKGPEGRVVGAGRPPDVWRMNFTIKDDDRQSVFGRLILTFMKTYQVANKVEVFNKIKEIHHRIGTAVPQILVSLLIRELAVSQEEVTRHLEGLVAMDLLKFKGTAKGAVELTRSGLTTTMKLAIPKPEPEPTRGESV